MYKIISQLLVITLLSSHAAPLLKTGQTESYDTAGTVVTDASIKDDGFYQAGVTRSYSRSADVVTDNITALQWQDDAEAGTISKPWVTQVNYDVGNYFDTSGDTATSYCTELALDGGGWRLPSIEELETIVDYEQVGTALSEGVFLNYAWSNSYWSSTNDASNLGNAHNVAFYFGGSIGLEKSSTNNVRCVRGGQLDSSSLSRNANEVVSDSTTNLQWQDDAVVKTTTRTWSDSIDYCEALTLDGQSDWRLPNANELLSIVDRSQFDPSIDASVFLNTALFFYWSSTTSSTVLPDVAWDVDFVFGALVPDQKGNSSYARCVRGGQTNTPNTVAPIIMYLLN